MSNILIPAKLIKIPPPINIKNSHRWIFKDVSEQYVEDFQFTIFAQATVISRFILNGNLIIQQAYCSSQPIPKKEYLKTYLKLPLYKKRRIRQAISLITLYGKNYHHWLAEVIPIIVYSRLQSKEQIPFLIPSSYLEKKFIREYIALMEVEIITYDPREKIVVDRLIAYKNISISHFHPELFNETRSYFQKLLKYNHEDPSKRIFISRNKASRRKITNEEVLYPLLHQNGFEVLELETHSVAEQIKIFMSTKYLVSIHGAGLTNMMFMPKGGKVMELRALTKETHIYNVFYCQAIASGHDYYYQIYQGDHTLNKFSNITVDPTVFEKELTTFLD